MKAVLILPLVVAPSIILAQKPSDWRKSNMKPIDFAKKMDAALLNLKGAIGEASYTCMFFDTSMGQAQLSYRVRDNKTYRVDMVKVAKGTTDPLSRQTVVGNAGKVTLISKSTGFKPLTPGANPKFVPASLTSVAAWPSHFQQSVFQSYVTGKGAFEPLVKGLLKGDGGFSIKMESRTMIGNGRSIPQVRLFAIRTPAAAKKLGPATIEIIAAEKMWLPLQNRVHMTNLKGQKEVFDWTCLWRGPMRHDNKWFVIPKQPAKAAVKATSKATG